jgi:NAD(P)-dependent dehydrogenase (short-subunit alcohol dehydrogenase family)
VPERVIHGHTAHGDGDVDRRGGMGTATAHMFAREGAKVVIADVLEHEGRQVADGIGVSARFEPLDVTQEGSWAPVVAATSGHFGKLDVLVNNAGISGGAEQDFYSTDR